MQFLNLLLFSLIHLSPFNSEKSYFDVYSLNFPSLDSGQIYLNNFAGEKILVVAFDASNPNQAQLQGLDSIYNNSSDSLNVIGIPVTDFGQPLDSGTLVYLLRDSFHVSFPIAAISQGQRGIGQHPLMQWITTNSDNNPYNVDLDNANEMFVISTAGTLYAVLESDITLDGNFMQTVLNTQPSQ